MYDLFVGLSCCHIDEYFPICKSLDYSSTYTPMLTENIGLQVLLIAVNDSYFY